MRTLVILATVLILATAVNAAADGPKLETEEQKTLYALGLTINRSLSPLNLSPSELELVEAGLADGSLHKTPKVDLETYGPKIKQIQEARAAAVAAAEKKSGQVFVDQATREPGATKTASGLIRIPITPGTGASPKATDTVTVKYEGRLIDGTVFDSSRQRGESATVPLNGVIKCWTEALELVKVGGKSRLVCPADLAYGDQGWPPLIKPGATLVYEVELLGISQPSARTTSQSAQASSWYYCNDAKAYYPYVRECRSGWLRVVPQTAAPGQ
ncbi:MAG: peptidylprolyl isomerase [Candidatus Rokuibacteriota bacterium]|nr:MAG: peptidylprolyl isomerase [Candidatus Rokubacteria bacterium]